MITKIYVNNYKCLVNFDLELSKLSLLLGLNGSGKSSVFEVIHRLKRLITGEARVGQIFPQSDKTRWVDRNCQEFGIEMEGNDGLYRYDLTVEHHEDKPLQRIKKEKLHHNGKPLYSFENGEANLFRDNYSAGPHFLADWTQSGLGSIQERNDNKKLCWFRERIEKTLVLSIDPRRMTASSSEEAETLSPDFGNFASWYRFFSQEYQENLVDVKKELMEVIQGFDSLRIQATGDKAKSLQALFDFGNSNKPLSFGFDELSDGQRALIVLYTLLFGLRNHEYAIFLDEPDNYLALAEVQPWLDALMDKCDSDEIVQAALISHHPELIDHLGGSRGILFEHDESGLIHTKKAAEIRNEANLKLSEIIARGWEK